MSLKRELEQEIRRAHWEWEQAWSNMHSAQMWEASCIWEEIQEARLEVDRTEALETKAREKFGFYFNLMYLLDEEYSVQLERELW